MFYMHLFLCITIKLLRTTWAERMQKKKIQRIHAVIQAMRFSLDWEFELCWPSDFIFFFDFFCIKNLFFEKKRATLSSFYVIVLFNCWKIKWFSKSWSQITPNVYSVRAKEFMSLFILILFRLSNKIVDFLSTREFIALPTVKQVSMS